VKISNDIIGNRTRDLPTFSALPQPTAPLRAPQYTSSKNVFKICAYCFMSTNFVSVNSLPPAVVYFTKCTGNKAIKAFHFRI
jgi:hypothetical protein